MAASNYGLADDFFSKDWVLFPNCSTPKTHLEHNFDEDISALEQECSPLDSGYFSSGNLESSPTKKAAVVVDESKISHSGAAEHVKVQARLSPPATAASTKPGHASIHNSVRNESTTTIEKVNADDGSSKKSPKRRVVHDADDPTQPRYTQCSDKATNLTPLQSWVGLGQVDYRHEFLAYRLEETAKRRKTGTRRE